MTQQAQSIIMPEQVTREWVERCDLVAMIPRNPLILDFQKTVEIDSAGVACMTLMRRRFKSKGVGLEWVNTTGTVAASLNDPLLEQRHHRPKLPMQDAAPWYSAIGDYLAKLADSATEAFSVLTEILYWGTFGLLKSRYFRRGVFQEQMYQLGYNALLIVFLLAFLIGIVLSMQTAMQLKLFGADIYLVAGIAVSMLREIGPLMTAIILAGRSGSATTAEIATMSVQEEIDALKTMGINYYQFVIVPKFWSISITMPLLSVVAMAAGILGGFVVSILYLDMSPYLFWGELTKYVMFKDFFAGFIKSIAFSWLIIWIGTFYGLRVRGGAEEVGRETTASVVSCIFAIIVADAVFSFIL